MSNRARHVVLFVVAAAIVAAACALLIRPFPSDHTPEGAYMRIAHSVTEAHLTEIFPYLETDAQWASFTIRDMRKKSVDRISSSYAEPDRSRLIAEYEAEANAADGSDLFALLAKQRGWDARLRKDLSGVVRLDIEGERATVVTARGTRYPFRKRDNGIWGLTIFTADLIAESERASRDWENISRAADDYDRVKNASASHSP
ncbi:MAG: hypothetical protein ABI461_22065 [Polyangiaceae bacterium]